MLAKHPITGEPIRILRTDVNLHIDNRTAVWLRPTFQKSHRWSRWSTLISEPAAADHCDGPIAALVILRPDPQWIPILRTFITSETDTLVFHAASCETFLQSAGVADIRCLSVDDLYERFPFLGASVTAKTALEGIMLCIAHSLHCNKLVWSSDITKADFDTRRLYDSWKRNLVGELVVVLPNADDSCIPRTWLITQYFQHKSSRRAREIDSCLGANIANPLVDTILLLNESSYTNLPKSEKIHVLSLAHRITYYDAFKAAIDTVPLNDIVIVANADIEFDSTISYLWRLGMKERRLFLALLRWESDGKIFGPRSDSQDTWILSRATLDFPVTESEFGFPFGKPGCDNALALLMMKNKCLVANPAHTIKTWHRHSSNIRNYDPKDVLYRPMYLYIDPTAIQPYGTVRDLSSYVRREFKPRIAKPFARPILHADDRICEIFHTMLRTRGVRDYTRGSQNLYVPSVVEPALFHFSCPLFSTRNGLLYDFTKLYTGKYETWIQQWQTTAVSSLMPVIHVPALIAVACSADSFSSLSRWCLDYLAKALPVRALLLKTDTIPDLLIPEVRGIHEFMSDMNWLPYVPDEGSITVTPAIQDTVYYSENLWSVPPTDLRTTTEDIAVLRSLLVKTETRTPTVVFCVDETRVLNQMCASEIATHIFKRGRWNVHYISPSCPLRKRRQAFAEAHVLIGMADDSLEWIWFAKSGSTVIQVQDISEPSDTIAHLAGACEQNYGVIGLQKIPVELQHQYILLQVGKLLMNHPLYDLKTILKGDSYKKPVIILPESPTGIHVHEGDAFREMVLLWEERGYCQVEHSTETPFCWWDSIGTILLYDRETPRWLDPSLSYVMALFGNPAPPGPVSQRLRQSIWGYWPRSPRTVEIFVLKNAHRRSFSERTIRSIFLGKIRNGIQHARRTAHDWSAVIERFSMPTDSTGHAYPYTQDEYLELLCQSKYGLCLGGSGAKCHREIEYFAMGCVPLVTPDVDMVHYLDPPVEGVHYLRISGPDDVSRVIEGVTETQWQSMSEAGHVWWKKYASAEGFFKLTGARIEQCRPYFKVGIPQKFIGR